MLTIRSLTAADSAAIFAYLAAGKPIRRFKAGLRALPPTYSDSDPRKPRFYCLHNPESVSC